MLSAAANFGAAEIDFPSPAPPLITSRPAQNYGGNTLPGFTTYLWLQHP